MRVDTPDNIFAVVPIAAELNGDFSHSQFASTAIFDPATTVVNGTSYSRQALSNSMIPRSRLNPLMKSYLESYFDKPNSCG
jgi:hypothetical protein